MAQLDEIYTDDEVEKWAPLYGNYGLRPEYVLPEEFLPAGDENLDDEWAHVGNGYCVSTSGKVFSYKSNRFIKPKRLDKHGHVGICMSDGKKKRYEYLHRMMADAFLPKKKGCNIVRHLNDDPNDNTIENIARGTQKENMQDCISNKHFYYITDDDRRKGLEKMMIPTIAIDKNGNELYFESMNEASRQLNIPQANIWKVLNGERRTAGGYSFKRGVKD